MALIIDTSWDAEPERHWRAFVDFCRHETWAGGPDPHMAVVGRMIEGEPLAERVWRMGCYLSVFNVPTAEVIWRRWSRVDALNDRAGLESWLREHWALFGVASSITTTLNLELHWVDIASDQDTLDAAILAAKAAP